MLRGASPAIRNIRNVFRPIAVYVYNFEKLMSFKKLVLHRCLQKLSLNLRHIVRHVYCVRVGVWSWSGLQGASGLWTGDDVTAGALR